MKRWKWLIYLLSVGLLMIGCQDAAEELASIPAPPTIPPLPNLDPDEITVGQQVYAIYCASCHGANLEGESNWMEKNEDGSFRAPPHDLDGHTWHHGDTVLIEAIVLGGARFEGKNIGGTSNMPAFGEILTTEEITAVISYMKSSWPEEVQTKQWEVTVMTESR